MSRNLAGIVLGVCAAASAVMAQDPIPQPPNWDVTDPVNVAQKAEFTVRWMQGIDDGNVKAAIGCFSFTNSFTGMVGALYSDEFALFEAIYNHRLGSGYTIF